MRLIKEAYNGIKSIFKLIEANESFGLDYRRLELSSTVQTLHSKCWKTGGMWTLTALPNKLSTPWKTLGKSTENS